MEVFLSALCGLAMVILVITVVGHLLWLFFAAILRALSGEKADRRGSSRACVACGRVGTIADGRCWSCHALQPAHPPVSQPASLTQELEAAARHLERMHRRGIIGSDEHERMQASIRADLARLHAPPTQQPVTAPTPHPAAPAASEAVIDATLVESAGVAPVSPPQLRPAQTVPPAPLAASPFAPTNPLAPVRKPGVVHPLDRPEPVISPAPPQPSVPRQTLIEMLQSFMEERNIRWLEVASGLTIVICSIGLVWSLQSTLKAIPYAPAFLFMLFTVAFHGAGLYSLRRWKLAAISRTILIISLLLVPLGFSAGIVLSGSGETRRAVTDPLFLGALVIGTLVFGAVTVSAARETVGAAWWRMSIAVLGSSLAQVFISRLAAETSLGRASLLAAVPLGCFMFAVGGQLLALRQRVRVNQRRVVDLFLVLGIAAFALLVPLALLVHGSGERLKAVADLSPMICLAAAATLAAGLAIHSRALAQSLTPYRLAGTSVAVLGGIAMLAAVALAWPRPELLIAVGAASSVVLFSLAVVSRIAPLFGGAWAAAALACVVATHVVGGTLPLDAAESSVLLHALLTCRSGLVLTIVAAVAGIGGWQLLVRGLPEEGAVFLVSAAGFSALSATLAAFAGYVPQRLWQVEPASDVLWAAPLLLVHGLALIALTPRFRLSAATVAGSALLWLGVVHGVAWNESVRQALETVGLLPARPVLCATLIHSVLAGIVALVAAGRGVLLGQAEFASLPQSPRFRHLTAPLSLTAAAALAGALPFIVWAYGPQLYWHASYAAWGAVVCLTLLLIWRHPAAFASLQAMLALAAGFLTAAICRGQLASFDWRFDWRHLDAQLIVVALTAAAWSGFRRLAIRWPIVRQLTAHELTVDQGLLALAAIAVPLLAVAGAMPGVIAELDKSFVAAESSLTKWTASAGGIGDTLAVAAVAGAFVALLVAERRVRDALGGLVAVLFAGPWLAGHLFAESMAVGSAARWGLAVYVAGFCAVSLAAGKWLAKRTGLVGEAASFAARPIFAVWPYVLGGAAILAITIAVVAQSLAGHPLGGPSVGSWFAALGPTLSFGIPLSVLVVVSLAFSLAWRRAEMSIVASALFQLTANLAFLIYLSSSSAPSVPVRWVEWLQWNALALGLFGVVWSAVEWWKKRRDVQAATLCADLPIERLGNLAQLFLCGLAVRALAAWAAGAVVWVPDQVFFVTSQLGDWQSYAALGFAAAFLLWRSQRRLHYLALGVVAIAVMLVAFVSATVDGFDPVRQWLAYHVLTAGLLAVGALSAAWYAIGRKEILSARSETRRLTWPVPDHWAAGAAAGLVILLAIRGTTFDPAGPWWSAGAALGGIVVACGLALVCRSQWYAYASTVLAFLPVAIFLIDAPLWAAPWRTIFGEACLLAPIVAAAFWLWREVRSQHRNDQSFDARFHLPAVHRFSAAAGLAVMTLLVAWRLLLGISTEIHQLNFVTHVRIDMAQGVALVALLALIAGSLWDRRAVGTIPFLYYGGLLVVGLALHLLRWPISTQVLADKLPPFSYVELLAAAAPLAVAIYVALTGELWHRGALLSLAGRRLGICDPVAGLECTVRWLPAVSLVLALGVCVASFFGVLSLESLALRVMAGFAPLMAAWGIARQAQQQREMPLQLASLALAGLSAVLLGWAEMPPGFTEASWMTRMFRLLMALSALTFLYGLAAPRLLFTAGAWNRSFRQSGYASAVLAIAAFVAVLALEFVWFDAENGAPVGDVQVAAVAVVLFALIAGLISLALFPNRDPLTLSEAGRTGYVYAAEAVLALLFAHLYLCKPFWFSGILRPYWPYVLMAIAFVGVGAAEIFTRLRLRVLSEPLRNTGALMPLLPALAMWIVAPAESDYALVLFLAGVMYVALSVTQHSWLFAAAAGVAANGALWTILHRHDFDFTANPQFWLIPPAVSVLIGAQLNRHRLDPRLLAAVRYAAVIVIYLSSTSEIWIHNIDKTVWPQILLLGLSLLGVLAGVLFRVRAFLYLGTGFTLVALCAMVWHAHRAIGETWPLWTFGIGVGLAIFALLAFREKKREQIEAMLAGLRKWEQ